MAGSCPGARSRTTEAAELHATTSSAATPATCGEAIEVPLMVLVALVLVCHAEVMPTPGAKRSTHVPPLENDAMASLASLTGRASFSCPSDQPQAAASPAIRTIMLLASGESAWKATADSRMSSASRRAIC